MKKQIFSRLLTCGLLTAFAFTQSYAQQLSASEEEVLKQRAMSAFPVSKWDSLRCAWYAECQPQSQVTEQASTAACPLNKRMFGWHAIGTSSSSYVWQSLSDLSYFSYDVNPSTGQATNAASLVNWGNSATVLAAKANGVRVNLAVTFFGNGTTFPAFFDNATAQNTLITNLINEVTTADVNGLNIDFEGTGLSTTYAAKFTTFLGHLRSQLLAARPTAEISIDIQGSHAASPSYITNLNPVVDLFILMGYDYYWGSQHYPGPVAPTWQFPKAIPDPNGHGFVANDLNTMLRYAPKEKVLLAMPYYGRRWRTTNGCVLPADGSAASISPQTYKDFRDNVSGYYNNTLRDPNAFTAYHCFNDLNAVPNQQFIDDVYSLQTKYDLIHHRGLAGGAVWRLGYDAGYPDLWNLVNENLSTCGAMPCRDTIYDMGGPLGNYVSRSNYFFTIDPPGAAAVSLRFLSFNFEEGWDSVWVYDGVDTSNSLVLGRFSGTTVPPTLVANSGKLTIKVFTDNATTRPGFVAVYNCSPQLVRSVTSGNWEDPNTWETGAVPLPTDNVLIMAGHQVSVFASHSVATLQVNTGGAVILNGTALLTVLE